MPKKPTVRFYTSHDRYVDWKYLHELHYFEIIRWLDAGNYLLVNEQRFDSTTKSNNIFALLRRTK